MTRRINAEGLALIKRWEGLRLEAYQDVGGVWTIGYGSTGSHVHAGLNITEAGAEALLLADLERFEAAVDRLVKVPLSDNQFAACVSLAFNIGEGAFAKSTLLNVLNQGRYDDVPAQFMRWNKVGKKVVDGLTNRRAAECGLWAKGAFVASNTVVPETPKPKPAVADPGVQASILSGLGTVGVGTVIATAQQGGELKTALEPVFGDWAVPLAAAFVIMTLASTVWFAIRVAQRRKQEAA